MTFHPWQRRIACAWSLGVCALAAAQAQTEAPTPADVQLKAVTVVGNPLGTDELITPVTQYSGAALTLRREATLGETLNATPGVSSTYFGPNASRPIIRGQDGDRIRVLQNGGASLDASGLSFDHAVALDPLSVSRIEVLRGPAALPYGGSAVGGVVNVIDNRIAPAPLFDAAGGVGGTADLGLSSVNGGRNGGLALDLGSERYNLHLDAFDRHSGDTRVPTTLACTQGGVTRYAARLCNSAAQSAGMGAGGSLFFDRGYLGLSASQYRSHYGTVAEDESTIRMQSTRYALEAEQRDPGWGLQSLQAQWAHSDYQHTEFDAGTPQTRFANQGNALRVQARQIRHGDWDGLFGYQAEQARFSADGAEAFAPYSRSSSQAVFAYQELARPWGTLSLGGRWAVEQVDSLGHPSLARFQADSHRFTPRSAAAGARLPLSAAWRFTSNLAYTERAPKDYELYANGPHAATAAYEVGNAQLSKEQSLNLDLGFAYQQGADTAALTGFVSRFRNYMSLDATGYYRDAAGNGGQASGASVSNTGCADAAKSAQSGCSADIWPEFAYTAVGARFYGLEANGKQRLPEWLASTVAPGSRLEWQWRADLVRAQNTQTGQPLPRIAPLRLGSTLAWTSGPWSLQAAADYFAAQNRLAPLQPPTGSYTLLSAASSYKLQSGARSFLWYAKLDNAANALAYSATSVLTQTAPGKVPLPGRNLKLGLQVGF